MAKQDASAVDRIGLRLRLRKAQAAAGDITLLFGDESEALTHPYLAQAWAQRGADLRIQAPGQAQKVAMMGAQDAVTRVMVNVGKALGAYQRLLSCGPSRFDRWMQGDASALTRSEQRGAGLFVGKGKCSGCHSGPFLSDEKFHNVGMRAAVIATVFLNINDPGASVGVAASNTDPLNVKGAFSDGDDGRL